MAARRPNPLTDRIARAIQAQDAWKAAQGAADAIGMIPDAVGRVAQGVQDYAYSRTPEQFGQDVYGLAYRAADANMRGFTQNPVRHMANQAYSLSPLAAIPPAIRAYNQVVKAQQTGTRPAWRDAMGEVGLAAFGALPGAGGKGKAASRVLKEGEALLKAAEAPAAKGVRLVGADADNLISTRRPSAAGQKTYGDPSQHLLTQTGADMRLNPKAFEGNMRQVAELPFMAGFTSTDPEAIYREAVRRGADNLKFIGERMMSPGDVGESRTWYDVAHEYANQKGLERGVPEVASQGVLAAFSPQTPWPVNVARHNRLIDMNADGWQSSAAEQAQALRWGAGKAAESPRGKPNAFAKVPPEELARIMATPMEELNTRTEQYLKAAMTDSVRNDPVFPVLGLDGKFTPGKDRIQWGNGQVVGSSMAMLQDPTWETVNRELAGGGKVPSFFNNIAAPLSRAGISTIDTHSAGAASLYPGGGNDPVVYRAMGLSGPTGGPKGAFSSDATGSKGHYGLFSDMHQLAADEMGMLPREVQSITWEGVRRLWGEDKKTAELKQAIEQIHRNAPNPQAARIEIARLLGH